MTPIPAKPVVHLELHTGDLPRACAFYAQVCGWRPERIEAGCGSYWVLATGGEVGGGVVECAVARPLWLPYVEVGDIVGATDQACRLGASLLLAPREGPAGWRSVVAPPAGGELAFWEPKRSLDSNPSRDRAGLEAAADSSPPEAMSSRPGGGL